MAKRTVYHPPPKKTIDAFAEQVGERLGKEQDAEYHKPEFVSGLARFLEVVSTILAKQLSQESEEAAQSLDSESK